MKKVGDMSFSFDDDEEAEGGNEMRPNKLGRCLLEELPPPSGRSRRRQHLHWRSESVSNPSHRGEEV